MLPEREVFYMANYSGNKKGYFQVMEIILLVFVLVFGGYIFMPQAAEAFLTPTTISGRAADLEILAKQNKNREHGRLPEIADSQPKKVLKIITTAYSSEVGQTDSTPFITASGTTVRHGVVAANFLPIGTKVRFPELYGNEVFVVEDRMNPRFNRRVDIWMEKTPEAKQFGVKWTTVEVF